MDRGGDDDDREEDRRREREHQFSRPPRLDDRFDVDEFDIPPSVDPAFEPSAEYRVLLDAMRRAGAEGVAQQTAALTRQIAQDTQQRAEWVKDMGNAIRDLQRSTAHLQQVSAGVWWDRLKEWFSAALIGLGVIVAAALGYEWGKAPKIESHYYGCERVIRKGDALQHFKHCLELQGNPNQD